MEDKSNEIFLEGTLKILIAQMPILGPILNEIMFDMPGRIKSLRFESLLNQLKLEVKNIKLNQKEYFKSEDFYDLTYSIFEKSLRTKSTNKHKVLAKIYVDFINRNIDFDEDVDTIFVDFTLELKPVQFSILLLISEFENDLKEIGNYQKFYNIISSGSRRDINKDEFKLHILKLESFALISTGSGLEDFDQKTSFIVDGDHEEPSVKCTSIGHRYLKYIEGNTWHNNVS